MIDLSNWKLTLPIDNAAEIMPYELADYESEFFERDGSSIIFRCPVAGDTTENAKYPRTELRQMIDPTDDDVNWRPRDGASELRCVMQVNRLPLSGKVIIAQIHGYDRSPLLKVQFEKGKVYGLLKTRPRNGEDKKFQIVKAYADDYLHITIGCNANCVWLSVNGAYQLMKFDDFDLSKSWVDTPMYFRCGCYPQDNKGDENAQVTLSKLSVVYDNVDETADDEDVLSLLKSIDGKLDRIIAAFRAL